jgi:LuxR family maltose regulon positive regulatory protein
MAKLRPQLAKLTRPRLHKAVVRERLFALLDEAREHKPAICVVGPPGAGKTTLVASWLDARGIKGIWYQVDPGDADLATFFYYLGEAAKPFTRKGQRPLPVLTPEYLHDVEGFSRRFFRELFGRLPKGAAVVLDNYQEVGPEQKFHQLIAQAVEEVSPGITLIAVSRRDPPDCYARLIANENVQLVEWEALKLTFPEAEAIAGLHCRISRDLLTGLHHDTGGWAAGLVLTLEQAARGLESADAGPMAKAATFDYFASQIFEKVHKDVQEFLMRTAYLPHVPVTLARDLTGNPAAAEILEDLYRRHLFVHRRTAAEGSYSYHALFQEFLQAQSRKRFSTCELEVTQMRAADLLAQHGNAEAAASLYCRAQSWDRIEQLIIGEASELIGQGRWRTVIEWASMLPKVRLEQSHWALHWKGIAFLATSPVEAREDLERSFRLAATRGDDLCRVLTASGIIQAYLLEYNRFRPLDRWINELTHALPLAKFPTPEAEIRAQSALLTALSFRMPDHPALDQCAQRVLDLLPSVSDANLRLSATVFVFAWGSLSGPLHLAARMCNMVKGSWLAPGISALNAALAGYILAWYHCLKVNREECLTVMAELEGIADREGLPMARAYAATIGAWLEMDACNLSKASYWVSQMDSAMDTARPFDRYMSDAVHGWHAFLTSRLEGAKELLGRAVTGFDEIGSVFHQVVFRGRRVWIELAHGEVEAARSTIVEMREIARPLRCLWLEIGARVAEAIMALDRGDRAGAAELTRSVFTFARERGEDHALGKNVRPWMPRLSAFALESEIEVPYVRKLISRFSWPSPAERLESWPWAIRIYTLGGLRILVGDQPLRFERKTPRKPMGLLNAIIAYGETEVPSARLIDALWPDEDGDAAYHNLGINLHRLRRLLGGPDTVLLTDGKVSLNADLVWTDVSYCDQAFGLDAPKTIGQERALELYRGDFLAESDEAPWILSRREQIRSRFIRALIRTASELERSGDRDQAIALYRKGIAADELAEEFHQGIIRCYASHGEPREAQAAFHNLTMVLRARHGTRLTPTVRALMQEFPGITA